jgi:hypothetical protein
MHKLPNRIDTKVLSELLSIIDYDDLDYGDRPISLVFDALAEICNNIVGNAMFRRLITEISLYNEKLPPVAKKRMIKIVNLGAEEETRDEGSRYSHTTYTVKVNLNMYDDDGTGIPGRKYYGLDDSGNITHKDKSLVGSLFHEFTHCLHHVENSELYDLYRKSKLPTIPEDEKTLKNQLNKGNPWTNKEERRTISGCMDDEVYDPICDQMFDYCQSVSKKVQFCPRYSHLGCGENEDDNDTKTKLQKYLQFDKKLMNL